MQHHSQYRAKHLDDGVLIHSVLSAGNDRMYVYHEFSLKTGN